MGAVPIFDLNFLKGYKFIDLIISLIVFVFFVGFIYSLVFRDWYLLIISLVAIILFFIYYLLNKTYKTRRLDNLEKRMDERLEHKNKY